MTDANSGSFFSPTGETESLTALPLQQIVTYDNLSYVTTVINDSIQTQLDRDIKNGFFAAEVRNLIAYWVTELREIGYEEYIESPLAKSFEDHPLRGSRQGERAISLNTTGGRLIYVYRKNKVLVKVIKITPDHNYD